MAKFSSKLQDLPVWQMLLALACFAFPLALYPVARGEGSSALWEYVQAWPGDQLVRHLDVGGHGTTLSIYAAGAVSGIYVSTAGGENWIRSNMHVPYSRSGVVRISYLDVNSSDPDVAYAVLASSSSRPRPMLYWTENGGLSWRARGGLGPKRIKATAFAPMGEELYLAAAGDLLRGFTSQDGQKRFIHSQDDLWEARVAPLDPQLRVSALAVGGHLPPGSDRLVLDSSVQHDSSAQWVVYIGTIDNGLQIMVDDRSGDGPLFPIHDDAVSLYVRQKADIHALCFWPDDPRVVYAGTDEGIYVSQDAGVSWSHTPDALRSLPVLSLLIDPVGDTLYAGLAGDGVFYSEDQGATWFPLGRGLGHVSVYSLALVESEIRSLFAGTSNGLWRFDLSKGKAGSGAFRVNWESSDVG